MAKEIGKPVRFGEWKSRVGENDRRDRNSLRNLARSQAGATAASIRRPHGVVAVITPWNNPIYLALGKIIPAILYGNTVVWKPARDGNWFRVRRPERMPST